MYRFFVDRPIVAIVIAILMVLLGGIAMFFLPVAQFPNIVPPEIQVTTTYVGADAITVEESVATPIEQQVNGVDRANYMYSINANTGQMTLRVNFEVGTDPNIDQILTQMRVTQAQSQLPPEVNNFGVDVVKSPSAPLLLIALYSPNETYDATFLANYAYINLVDPLTRIDSVSNVNVFGAGEYAMRLWVKPDQLSIMGITIPEIVQAIQSQNTVNPAGKIGAEPAPPQQEFTYSVRAKGRLSTPEEFENLVLRANPDGSTVKLRDVGYAELGAQTYNVRSRMNGKPAAVLAIYQLPGTNALKCAEQVKAAMKEMAKEFPPDMEYVVSLDTTKSVEEGMKEILSTLVEAMILVVIVVFLFLQGWRATLIPLCAVPVSLIGTFMVFPMMGFTINTLALLGLILAIGLVVDDAIVVVEAVEKEIENGLPPREATLKAMSLVSGPVIGIALVLSAVFLPTAFIPGITGQLYKQFALTIAVSVLLSAFNALTLSPALSALLLRPKKEARGPLGWFYGRFNHYFGRATRGYVSLSHLAIRKSLVSLLILAGFGLLSWGLSKRIPGGFLPDEDQGYVYCNLQLPSAASLQRTDEAAKKIEEILKNTPGVKYYTSVVGFSLLSTVQTTYSGFFFVSFEDWSKRTAPNEQYQAIKNHINAELSKLTEGIAFCVPPPSIPGVGTSGGFTMALEDRSGSDIQFLATNVEKFLEAARKRPELTGLTTTFLPSVPQIHVEVDKEKALKQGVSLRDVYTALQTYLGGNFINYFNRFGRQWQVYLEAEQSYRNDIRNLDFFYVKNDQGKMVPLSSLTRVERRAGPEFTSRYNLYRFAQINGSAAPGYSSDQALAALEETFYQTMPKEMGFDYIGMAFQEKLAKKGIPAWAIFATSLVFVFLILAALYESWSLPFSVLLGTPIAVAGAFLALFLRDIENNIYAQIGLVMLIGLSAKNAILIVEYAKTEYEKGRPLLDATLAGAELRLRPILMTSFAFILGCVPLWAASGAGAQARRIIGTTVIGGMTAASFIAIFLIPVTFYVVERISGTRRKAELPPGPPEL